MGDFVACHFYGPASQPSSLTYNQVLILGVFFGEHSNISIDA